MFDKAMDILTQNQEYKDIFNQRADSYHKAMLEYPQARDQEFQAVLDMVRFAKDDTVIDYPAGGGYLSWYVPRDIQMVHVETSELFAELGHSRSPFPQQLCACNEIDQNCNSVDWILSVAGLHHVMNKLPLFKEFARTLRPGGQLVMADASQGSKVARFLDDWVGSHSSTGHTGSYFNDTTLKEINRAGLALLRLQEKHYHWRFPSKQDAARYCKLMFGADLASEAEMLEALEQYLGFEQLEQGVGLKWQLQFISCIKPLAALD